MKPFVEFEEQEIPMPSIGIISCCQKSKLESIQQDLYIAAITSSSAKDGCRGIVWIGM